MPCAEKLENRRGDIFLVVLKFLDSSVNPLIIGIMEHRKDFNCNGAVKHTPEERAPCLEPNMNNKKKSVEKVDVTVHLYDKAGCASPWTPREKHLTAVCALLFCACIAFVAVAFIRDVEGKSFCSIIAISTFINRISRCAESDYSLINGFVTYILFASKLHGNRRCIIGLFSILSP